MIPIYYIGKRTLSDVLHSGVFWGALVVAGLVCFVTLYVGWNQTQINAGPGPHHRGPDRFQQDQAPGSPDSRTPIDPASRQASRDPDNPAYPGAEFEDHGSPLASSDPKDMILWTVYGATIGFANLLAIFIMIGLLSREIESHRIDMLLARPVNRGQIYFGKLLGGWASIILYVAILATWTLACMFLSGIGAQPKYFEALAVGVLSPILLSTLTLFMSIWMKGILAGLIATIMTFAAGNFGIIMIKLLGIEVLKLDKVVYVIHRILPPLNVIGMEATAHLHKDLNFRVMQEMFESQLPDSPGLYTTMTHVWIYFAVVVILGYLSLFRRQFT
jgi:ABC-type transport system involved in multi-copper enzyme maturation permease subunit